MNYSESIQQLANNILENFDEVYFNAEIVEGNKRFPAISFNSEWIDLSPSDEKETIYIRRNGDDEVQQQLKIGSCEKAYSLRSPLRIVFFKDNATNQDEILYKLTQSVLKGRIQLKTIKRDKFRLVKDESTGDYTLGPLTVYFAIDVYMTWDLIPDSCEQDFCSDIVNPLKKLPCSVVA